MINARFVSAIVVIGSQWGDEGKGKVIDSIPSDYVVRYQGGANAGHTLTVGSKKIILHLIPSGILHPHTQCVITPGVVMDVLELLNEIRCLKQKGYLKKDSQLLISDSTALVLDYHKKIDLAREEILSRNKIGTTGRGIGPAYEDRAGRTSLLFRDLFLSDEDLKNKLERTAAEKSFLLSKFYNKKDFSLKTAFDDLKKARPLLEHYRCSDTSLVIYRALRENKKVLFEGAQGVLLDWLQGTYPYVTSSSTLAGSALTGAGVGWQKIDKVLGVAKAYTTRVGSGPFPSECDPKHQLFLEERGKERGATTQRKRRCGWLDLKALEYSVRINDMTHLALMKLDVLSGLKSIPICVSYKLKGKKLEYYPVSSAELEQCRPVYQEFSGWSKNLRSCKKWEDLPQPAQALIQFIENSLKIPIEFVSVGPEREETVIRSSESCFV